MFMVTLPIDALLIIENHKLPLTTKNSILFKNFKKFIKFQNFQKKFIQIYHVWEGYLRKNTSRETKNFPSRMARAI